MEGMERKVSKKMPGGDAKPLEDLGKVKPFPKGEFGTLDDFRLDGHAVYFNGSAVIWEWARRR